MAPAVSMNGFDGADLIKVAAPVGALLSISVLAELPELCLLIVLIAYAVFSKKNADSMQWLNAFVSQEKVMRVSETLRSKSLEVLLATLLMLSLVGAQSQLVIVCISGIAYCALYEVGRGKATKTQKISTFDDCERKQCNPPHQAPWRRRVPTNDISAETSKTTPISQLPAKKDVTRSRAMTSPLPLGTADAFVQELVHSSTPTKADEAVVRRIQKVACKCILPVVPEAEIQAIATSNLTAVGATGAKPEIEMVITVDPQVLANRLKEYFVKGQSRIQKSLDTLLPDVLQKTATKVLSERLTFVRFWRSQFSGPEPMIVLLVPVEVKFFDYPIRLNFSVNTPFPLRLSTVMSKEDARTRELILVVNRWARERCIANVSKGQPHAYVWSLFVMNFMRQRAKKDRAQSVTSSVEVLKEFVTFYKEAFDQQSDRLSIRFSQGVACVTHENASSATPYVEDPFDTSKNAAEFVTSDGVARVKEELQRAEELLSHNEVSLAALLQRWTPTLAEESSP